MKSRIRRPIWFRSFDFNYLEWFQCFSNFEVFDVKSNWDWTSLMVPCRFSCCYLWVIRFLCCFWIRFFDAKFLDVLFQQIWARFWVEAFAWITYFEKNCKIEQDLHWINWNHSCNLLIAMNLKYECSRQKYN